MACCLPNQVGCQAGIGPAGHGDCILSMGIDDDAGTTAGVRKPCHMGTVHIVFCQVVKQVLAIAILPYTPHQSSIYPHPCRGHSLISSLAAGIGGKAGSGHRLAGTGKAGSRKDQVDVDATDNYYLGSHQYPLWGSTWVGRASPLR